MEMEIEWKCRPFAVRGSDEKFLVRTSLGVYGIWSGYCTVFTDHVLMGLILDAPCHVDEENPHQDLETRYLEI